MLFNTFCSRFARFTVALKSKEGSISTRFLGGEGGGAVGKACAFTGKLLVTETFRAQELRQFFFISANPEEKYDGV